MISGERQVHLTVWCAGCGKENVLVALRVDEDLELTCSCCRRDLGTLSTLILRQRITTWVAAVERLRGQQRHLPRSRKDGFVAENATAAVVPAE